MEAFTHLRAYFDFVATDAEAWVGVDTWNPRMIPDDCESGDTKFSIKVEDVNGNVVGETTGTAYRGFVSLHFFDLTPNDAYKLIVEPTWGWGTSADWEGDSELAQDFTARVFTNGDAALTFDTYDEVVVIEDSSDCGGFDDATLCAVYQALESDYTSLSSSYNGWTTRYMGWVQGSNYCQYWTVDEGSPYQWSLITATFIASAGYYGGFGTCEISPYGGSYQQYTCTAAIAPGGSAGWCVSTDAGIGYGYYGSYTSA